MATHELALYGWHGKGKKRESKILDRFGIIDDPKQNDITQKLNQANIDAAKATIKQRREMAANPAALNHGWKYKLIKRKVGKWNWADEYDVD